MMESNESKFLDEIVLHQGIIHKICRIYHSKPADREDLYQEILFNAWKAFPTFEGRSKFSTWLYRVALNTALHQKRKNKFFGLLTDLQIVENFPAVHDRDERLDALYEAIGQLDPLEKSIAVLYLDDMSYNEISEVTGLTVNNVGVKLNRIKMKIKKIVSADGTR